MVCHVSCREGFVTKGSWTREEDLKLIHYIHTHGEGSWHDVPRKAGLRRCSKSCRLRWRNYLRPDVKRGNISESEEEIIWKLQALVGNRWSLIARRLPGRTDNEIKNFWNTHLKKKLRRMGIEPGTRRMIGSARSSSIPPEPTVPVGGPLEDPSAASQVRPTGYSVQISSEDRGNAPPGDSDFSAGPQSDIQAVARDPPGEEIKHTYSVQQTEHCLKNSTEQISYYDSVHSNSGPSCYSAELQQNYAQKADSQTDAAAEFMGCGGILSPDTLTGDSDSSEMKSMQEFCDEPFSPWTGLISLRFVNDCLQSMDALGDGGDHFGGFNQLLLW